MDSLFASFVLLVMVACGFFLGYSLNKEVDKFLVFLKGDKK